MNVTAIVCILHTFYLMTRALLHIYGVVACYRMICCFIVDYHVYLFIHYIDNYNKDNLSVIFLGFCQILNFVHIYFIFRTFRSFYFVAIKIERDKLGS